MMADVQKTSEGRESEQPDGRKGGGQMAWLTDMLEPAIKLYRRALPAGMDATSPTIDDGAFASLLL